jgi:hypothetical protein
MVLVNSETQVVTTTLVVVGIVMQVAVNIAFRVVVWYHEPHRDVASRPDSPQNGRVDKVLRELEAHADAVVRAEAEAMEHRQAIRKLLPKARAAGHGPAKLERTIHAVYVRDTISRWTQAEAVPRGKAASES